MTKQIEFYFDFSSPYSYIASEKIEILAERNEKKLVWKPMFLGGLFKTLGAPVAPGLVSAKKPYLFKDLKRLSKYHHIPIQFPDQFPVITVKAMRILFTLSTGKLSNSVHRLFRAYWCENRDISDISVLTDIFGQETVQKIGDQRIKQILIDATDEAVRRGIFGAPTFMVGDELFFGHDRMHILEAHLKGQL